MKQKYYNDNLPVSISRSLADRIGFVILCVLLMIQPFHFVIGKHFVYYREITSLLFAVLSLPHLQKRGLSFFQRREVFFLTLYLLFIIIAALFDSGVDLYGGIDKFRVSENITNINPSIYVLRNAFLYIPMVFYIALRRLSRNEIAIICAIITIAAPLSIIAFIRNNEIAEIGGIAYILELGGHGLFYNTYVPYLTFPIITALYLAFSVRVRILKIFFFCIAFGILVYLVTSTSRQSVLFVILIMAWFVVASKSKIRLQIILSLFAGVICFELLANYAISHYAVHSKLLDRFSSVPSFVQSRRLLTMKYGLELLSTQEYIFGAGLSSVIFSGPHNDYIRWTQRIGLLGMLLSFAPFFVALRYNLKAFKKKQHDLIYFLTSSGLFFTLYHSFFGYPRDDAYQSLYVFLGLALWLAISSSYRRTIDTEKLEKKSVS